MTFKVQSPNPLKPGDLFFFVGDWFDSGIPQQRSFYKQFNKYYFGFSLMNSMDELSSSICVDVGDYPELIFLCLEHKEIPKCYDEKNEGELKTYQQVNCIDVLMTNVITNEVKIGRMYYYIFVSVYNKELPLTTYSTSDYQKWQYLVMCSLEQ